MAKFKNVKKTKKQLAKSAAAKKNPGKRAIERSVSGKTPAKQPNKSIKQASKPAIKEQVIPQSKGSTAEFPKNSRSITERLFKIHFPQVSFTHRIWLHAINILALIGLLLVGIGLGRYIEQVEKLQTQKKQLEVQLSQWESVAQKYTGFRDLYLNIAILAFELKDFRKSQEYVEKALDIDPNYLPALKLKAELLTMIGK